MLAGQPLYETTERLIRHFNREVDFMRCPTECVHACSAASSTSLDELDEGDVVVRVTKKLASFVRMKDDVVKTAGYVKSP
jgi:hypothetical protein